MATALNEPRLPIGGLHFHKDFQDDWNTVPVWQRAFQKEVQSGQTEIDITGRQMGDAGADYVADTLIGDRSVQFLHMNKNRIQYLGGRHLGSMLELNRCLLKLDLSDNLFQDEGMMYIAAGMAENSTLLEINLCRCQIKDRGMREIANAMEKNSTIKTLLLTGNLASDKALGALARVIREKPPMNLGIMGVHPVLKDANLFNPEML